MACSCGKTNNTDLKTSGLNGELNKIIEKPVIFSTKGGKILYFSICLLICITPIINIAGLYFFYLAIFGRTSKVKKENTVKESESTQTKVELTQQNG